MFHYYLSLLGYNTILQQQEMKNEEFICHATKNVVNLVCFFYPTLDHLEDN